MFHYLYREFEGILRIAVPRSRGERLRRVIWRCNKKYVVKGEKGCENKHIDDRVLYQALVNTINAMMENKAYFREKWKEHLKSDNLLQRYKANQFIKIITGAEHIENFDMNLYFKVVVTSNKL